MEYGIQIIEGNAQNSENGTVLYTSGSSISRGQEKIYKFDHSITQSHELFTVWFVTTIGG
jgi:hypothetical protein